MPINYGQVGVQTATDGSTAFVVRQGKEAQQVVSQLHGAHYEATSRGNLFIMSNAITGLGVLIYTTTAPNFLLWNPTGSGKNLVLIRYRMAYAGGTCIPTGVSLGYIAGAGSAVATGAPISALTHAAPYNGLITAGNTTVAKCVVTAAATIAAAAVVPFYALFGESTMAAASTNNPFELSHEFEGSVIVPPGVAVLPVGTVATGAVFHQTLVWEEVGI